MDFSAQRDGFCDGFCGGFFVLCLSQGVARDGFCDGFWDLVSVAKDGKREKNIWGWKSTRKSTIKIHAELQVKHATNNFGSFLMKEKKHINKIPPNSRDSPWKSVYVFLSLCSMPNMTGRPGFRTMEMIGGSSAPYLARTPCVPLCCTSFNRVGNKERFWTTRGGRGIIAIVRWNLRPVIFGVNMCFWWRLRDVALSLWLTVRSGWSLQNSLWTSFGSLRLFLFPFSLLLGVQTPLVPWGC